MRKLTHTLSLLLVPFFMLSCKGGEEGASGVTGRVTAVEGSAANAIVKLYRAPDPTDDVSVWSVTDREDAVGFSYSPSFTFDHRLVQHEFVDTADGDGNFQIESVVGGNYIIVAEKLGQGWSVPRELNTTGADVDVGELRLPRVKIYDGVYVIDRDTTFEGGTHHVLRDLRLRVLPGRTLTIEPGAYVLLAGGSSLEIEGTLICQGTSDNFIHFMPADALGRDPDEWQELKYDDSATPPDLKYVSFRNGDVAVASQVAGGLIESCFFFRFAYGVQCVDRPPVLRRNVFDNVATGAYVTSTSGFLCERSVFQTSNAFALQLYVMQDCDINCNWFRDCGGSDTSGSGNRGVIKLDLVTDTEIHSNHFETSWFGLVVGSFCDSTTVIHHNSFNRMNTVMYVGVTEDQRGPSFPMFNYNCMTTIDRFVINVTCNPHNQHDIDGTNNFWNTSSIQQIKDRYIHDRDDDGLCPVVFIPPILNSANDVLVQTGTRCGICQ